MTSATSEGCAHGGAARDVRVVGEPWRNGNLPVADPVANDEATGGATRSLSQGSHHCWSSRRRNGYSPCLSGACPDSCRRGAAIVDLMGVQAPPGLLGIHTNMPGIFPADIDAAAFAANGTIG